VAGEDAGSETAARFIARCLQLPVALIATVEHGLPRAVAVTGIAPGPALDHPFWAGSLTSAGPPAYHHDGGPPLFPEHPAIEYALASPIVDRDGAVRGLIGAAGTIDHRPPPDAATILTGFATIAALGGAGSAAGVTAPATEPDGHVGARRFDDLQALAPAGIVETDLLGRCTFVSAGLAEICGLTPDAMIGRPFVDFIHRDNLARVMETFAAWERDQTSADFAYRVQRPDDTAV
jgi:hypothetical protein